MDQISPSIWYQETRILQNSQGNLFIAEVFQHSGTMYTIAARMQVLTTKVIIWRRASVGQRAFPFLLSWTLCLLCVKLVCPPLCSKGVFLGALISSSHGKPTWISRTLVLRALKNKWLLFHYHFLTMKKSYHPLTSTFITQAEVCLPHWW